MSEHSLPDFSHVLAAAGRIKPYITPTPLLQSSLLDSWLGHKVIFKAECFQRTGAFKLRGAMSVLTDLAERQQLPRRIVANSSGNHAQAVAYAAGELGIPVTIYTANSISAVKAAATEYYGAELVRCESRLEADKAVAEASRQPDTLWIPPFNHPQIIAGQGTATLEALSQTGEVDMVCAPCGGGGLLSGTLLASRALSPKAEVIGAEPTAANDAAQSLAQGKIVTLKQPPQTLADGAATPAVGDITFEFLKQLDDFYQVEEAQIAYWTQWLQHLLKVHVEPTSAMSMAAVAAWLQEQSSPKTVLVILSGGNIDQQKMQQIWAEDYLPYPPILD
ncbi:Threonine ammonia-lyase [Saliniradius amylolyticus]|uniref:Threonine ammonia-lyase n=1 Tax=Saliniradius amylolyticus TaxID=2183582 RepID=A0A2S2E013_9ALTE|nr:serine/threonine dehydratase [Saliniradius amylolyticus]AWL10995.1 Threonine ammonia-lyase [Saliniradius amylolyticus]